MPDVARLAGAKKGILPVFVEPSLAMLADKPPKGANWLHEIKYDGYRMQARLDGGKVKLLTRKGLDWTKRFPSIARALQKPATEFGLVGWGTHRSGRERSFKFQRPAIRL